MSPVLHAVLLWWRDRLEESGLPTTGAVPVLATARAEIIRPEAISSRGHWERIARKAGLVDAKTKALTHTCYCLRHTCANMWRVLDGIDLGHLRRLMRHKKINMTMDKYEHEAPHLAPLRREVQALGLERTPEGCIDGLGVVLAQRWNAAGLEVPRSDPRPTSLPQQRLPNYHGDGEPKALEGKTIDQTPTSVAIKKPAPQQITSAADWRKFCEQEPKRLRALGWTKQRIADRFGMCISTVAQILRSSDDCRYMRKTSQAERRGVRQRCREYYETGRLKTYREIGHAEGVRPATVALWARKDGWSLPREAPEYKLGKHDALIRKRLAARTPVKAIARELDVTPSAMWRYMNRNGLRDPAKAAADKAALKARVLKHLADGKSYGWIAKHEPVDISTVWRWNKERRADSQSPADHGTDLALDAAD
jgi:hypothetical protein